MGWKDRWQVERGFRVELRYGGGESFNSTVPPDQTSFFFPETDWPAVGQPMPQCLARKDYLVEVRVLLPGGDEPAGAVAVSGECGSGER